MIIREIIMWLSIMRRNQKEFPEVGNDNKIKALSEALIIIHKYEKIEQILKDIPYGGEATLRRIQEVVDNSESDFSDLDNCYEECPNCSLADGECYCLK